MTRIVSAIILAPAVVAPCWLGHIRHYLHATGDSTSRSTTSSRVSRCCRSPKSFVELFKQSACDIVCRDVDRVCNTHDNERSLGRERQHGIRGIQASSGSLLNFLDSSTTFADNGANENGRDEESKRISLGLRVRCFCEGLVV